MVNNTRSCLGCSLTLPAFFIFVSTELYVNGHSGPPEWKERNVLYVSSDSGQMEAVIKAELTWVSAQMENKKQQQLVFTQKKNTMYLCIHM